MRNKLLLGLGLGAGIFLFAASAQAQQAVIDPETGELLGGDATGAPTPAVKSAQAFSTPILGEPSDPMYFSNGIAAQRTGDESLVLLTVTIGQDGKPVVRHQSREEFDTGIEASVEGEVK